MPNRTIRLTMARHYQAHVSFATSADECRQARPQRLPRVTRILAREDRPVRKTCVETIGPGKRIRHRRQLVRHRLPRRLAATAEDARLRPSAAVRGVRAGAGGDQPGTCIGRIGGDRPGVVPVASLVRRLPGLPSVVAPRGSTARRLVSAAARVPEQGVHVALRARRVIRPGLTAVGRAHQPPELDPDEQEPCVVRARCDPARVRRPGPRREAPGRPRRQVEQRIERQPALAAVVRAEEPRRLRAGIHRAVDGETATENTPRSGGETSRHVAPPSVVLRTPSATSPA